MNVNEFVEIYVNASEELRVLIEETLKSREIPSAYPGSVPQTYYTTQSLS